ncbi:MAG: DUF4328 domain-containing protein [Bacteroidota bacterium]
MLQPNADRARNASLLLLITAGVAVLDFPSIFWEISLLEQIQAGEIPDEDIVNLQVGVRSLLALARFVLLILTAIFFVRWMVRAFQNHWAAGGTSAFTISQVQWAFFIPFVNLGRPYRVVQEFWHGMHQRVNGSLLNQSRFDSLVVGYWWAAWLLASIIANIAVRIGGDGMDAAQSITGDYIELVSNVVEIPAALLAVYIIRNYTKLEQQMESFAMIDQVEGGPEEEELPKA